MTDTPALSVPVSFIRDAYGDDTAAGQTETRATFRGSCRSGSKAEALHKWRVPSTSAILEPAEDPITEPSPCQECSRCGAAGTCDRADSRPISGTGRWP